MGEIKFRHFQIMQIRERKKPCLFLFQEPNSYVMIGQFKDDDCAELFAKRFNQIIDEVYEKGRADMRGEEHE